MPPKLVRTAILNARIPADMIILFGTYANAYHRLMQAGGLSLMVPRATFNRAMRGEPITPDNAALIEVAWKQWKERYLSGKEIP